MTWRDYFLLTLFVSILPLSACRKDIYDVPLPSEIKKSHRSSIGAYISTLIESDSDLRLLEKNESNGSAFALIQQLYDQSNLVMRLDHKSPASNRWNKSRPWNIHILDEPSQRAFIIPGGDLYISTGMLTSLRTESELFYLLTTEAILMNEKYLLDAMIKAYSTRTLMQIAEGIPTTDDRIESIVQEIPLFGYDLSISEIIKSDVAETMCATSLYNPQVAQNLLDRLSKSEQWLMTRPVGISEATEQNECGEIDTKGLYQTMILDVI